MTSGVVMFTINNVRVATLVITSARTSTSNGIHLISSNTSSTVNGIQLTLLESSSYQYQLIPETGLKPINIRHDGNQANMIKPHSGNHHFGVIETGLITGTVPIILEATDKEIIATALIEIRSYKTDYLSDYRTMLNEIGEYSVELVLDLFSISQLNLTSTRLPNKIENLQSTLAFLSSLITAREFTDAIERILAFPISRLILKDEHLPIERGTYNTSAISRHIARGGKRLNLAENHPLAVRYSNQRNRPLSLPASVQSNVNTENYDIPENQFIKYILKMFLIDIGYIKDLVQKIDNPILTTPLLVEINHLETILENWLSYRLLRDISDIRYLPLANPVLQRRNGYRKVLQSWLAYNLLSQISWNAGEEDIYQGGNRDIATLYEYWLFFTLLKFLHTLFRFEPDNVRQLYELSNDGIRLKLKAGQKLVLRATVTNNLRLEFTYNLNFGKPQSWSVPFRPDYTITFIDSSDLSHRVHLHFDAKYRIQTRPRIEELQDTGDESPQTAPTSFKRDDLIKMHAYHDAIANTIGAFILYPGNDITPVILQSNQSDFDDAIGAFAIQPGETTQSSLQEIKKYLDKVISELSSKWI